MIRITTRLSDGAVVSGLKSADKDALLGVLAAVAAENYGIDAAQDIYIAA